MRTTHIITIAHYHRTNENSTMFRLDGKTALITGAGSGIGAAIAHLFAQQGAHIFVADVQADAAQHVATAIIADNGRLLVRRSACPKGQAFSGPLADGQTISLTHNQRQLETTSRNLRTRGCLMMHFICTTCGTRYPATEYQPSGCPICQDERQYINPEGQQWISDTEMHGHYTNQFLPLTPNITAIKTTPTFAIGQRAYLLHTAHGTVLWDCITHLDDATIDAIRKTGGLAAIAISHPHFFSSMGAWSQAFGDVPIYLHAALRPYVMNPASTIHFWEGDQQEIVPGITAIRSGGHFLGSTVLHWRDMKALFTGDTIHIVADRRYVSFMYSYPNDIPLDEAAIRHIVESVTPFQFTTLFDAWKQLSGDAQLALTASANRYIAHLQGVPQR